MKKIYLKTENNIFCTCVKIVPEDKKIIIIQRDNITGKESKVILLPSEIVQLKKIIRGSEINE